VPDGPHARSPWSGVRRASSYTRDRPGETKKGRDPAPGESSPEETRRLADRSDEPAHHSRSSGPGWPASSPGCGRQAWQRRRQGRNDGQDPAGTQVITTSCVIWTHDIFLNAMLTGFPAGVATGHSSRCSRGGMIAVTPAVQAGARTHGLRSSRSESVLDTGALAGQTRAHRVGDRRHGPGTRSRWRRRAAPVHLHDARHVPTEVFAGDEDWGAADGSGRGALTAASPGGADWPPDRAPRTALPKRTVARDSVRALLHDH